MKPTPRILTIIQAIGVTFLWSTSWVLIKIGLQNSLPPLTFAGLRYTLAFMILIPFVLWKKENRASIQHLGRIRWFKLGILGIIFITITQGSMFIAISLLPANTLSLLLNLTPIFVGIAGISILNENPTNLQWAGIALAITGIIVYFFPANFVRRDILGIFVGIVCMLANVISSLLSREINRRSDISPLIVTFISMGIGSMTLLIIGLLTQGMGKIPLSGWLIIVWMSVVNTAFAFTLWNNALRVLTAVESSILNSLMLPQIAILAVIILGEILTIQAVMGLILVGLGTLVVQLKWRGARNIHSHG